MPSMPLLPSLLSTVPSLTLAVVGPCWARTLRVPPANIRSVSLTLTSTVVLPGCCSTVALVENVLTLIAPPCAPEPWESITHEQVAAALAELEDPFREVYELRLAENCSYDEIADRLTIPRSTVGTRLMRARHKLRETLLRAVA